MNHLGLTKRFPRLSKQQIDDIDMHDGVLMKVTISELEEALSRHLERELIKRGASIDTLYAIIKSHQYQNVLYQLFLDALNNFSIQTAPYLDDFVYPLLTAKPGHSNYAPEIAGEFAPLLTTPVLDVQTYVVEVKMSDATTSISTEVTRKGELPMNDEEIMKQAISNLINLGFKPSMFDLVTNDDVTIRVTDETASNAIKN